ncbi:MAG: hypothetical protein F6K49_29845 [Moorea sp. SIO3I6]|nr:hypothetical protein [Moorena sp. SIO3I6]
MLAGGLGGRNHTQNQQRQKFRSTRFGNWWAVPKNAMLGTSRYAIANTSISRRHCPAYYFL